MAKKKKYKALKIKCNTIVPKGAVGEKAVFKADGSFKKKGTDTVFKETEVTDGIEYKMYSIMYLMNKEDSQGDSLQDTEVRDEAMKDFMAEGDKIIKYTHTKKDGESIDIKANILELYVVKEGDPIFVEEYQKGAIANCIKFEDKEQYNFCKDNDWETSIEGVAEIEEYEEKSNDEEGLFKRFLKWMKSAENIEKDYNGVKENDNNTNIYKRLNMLDRALDDILWTDKTTDDKKAEIIKSIDQFKIDVETMTFEWKNLDKQKEELDMNKEDVLALLKEEIPKFLEEKDEELKKSQDKEKQEQVEKIDNLNKAIGELKDELKKANDEIKIQKDELIKYGSQTLLQSKEEEIDETTKEKSIIDLS